MHIVLLEEGTRRWRALRTNFSSIFDNSVHGRITSPHMESAATKKNNVSSGSNR